MSLAADGERRRDHSRSGSRDQRSKEDASRESSYAYPEDDLDDRHTPSRRLPYAGEGGAESHALYSYDSTRSVYRTASPPRDSPYRSSRGNEAEAQLPGAFPAEDDRPKRDSGYERRVRYAEDGGAQYHSRRDRSDKDELPDDKLKYLPQKYSRRYEEDGDSKKKDRRSRKERDEDDLAYGQLPPMPPRHDSPSTYGQLDGKRSSKYDDYYDDPRRRPTSPRADEYTSSKSRSSKPQYLSDGRRRPSDSDRDDPGPKSHQHSRREDPRDSKSNVLTVDPGSRDRDRSREGRRERSSGPSTLAVEPERRDRSKSRDKRDSTRDKSPQPPTGRMSTLTVDTGRPTNLSIAAAPPSPLLESYHGTYQDCSPMPSPLLLASQNPADVPRSLEPLSPINSDGEGDGGKRPNRRARFHDPEDIASRLARALKGSHAPDINPLVEILPSLTHEQVMELRAEYKRIVKTGSERKGVNVAKHIRSRLKDEEPILMKACYAVALGKWEGEAYWANFWYQGDKTRRELLIESLMGRTNNEIRRIKDAFTDKKYDNSLTKCMKTELKEDKFKKAVLLVLDERRMEEYDYSGHRLPIDYRLVDDDVDDLHKAVKSEKGGESLMISIVVQRSDSHLRAVLKEYEHHHRANFARDALKKSGNLVGELLAHILNGVINRPVRDALLLHHALTASRKDSLRRELLISRLVRFHWDPIHMQDIRRAYHERYGQDLQEAVREATSGQWGLFCRELCIARMPNDVRRMERVEIIR